MREWSPVLKRNAIIGMGVVLLLIALIMEPSIWALFTTKLGWMKIICSVTVGFVFAGGLYQLGEQALPSPIEPWYARPLGLGLLSVIMLLVNLCWVYSRQFRPHSSPITVEQD